MILCSSSASSPKQSCCLLTGGNVQSPTLDSGAAAVCSSDTARLATECGRAPAGGVLDWQAAASAYCRLVRSS